MDPTIRPAPKPVRGRRRRATVNLSRQLAFGRYERGESVSAVAEAIEKTETVALKYLLDYIRENRLTAPEPWVGTPTLERVAAVSRQTGTASSKAIRKALDDEATDDDVQICLACLANLE